MPLLSLFSGLCASVIMATMYYLPIYLRDVLGLTGWQIGLLLFIGIVSGLLSQIPNLITQQQYGLTMSLLILALFFYGLNNIEWIYILVILFLLFGFVRSAAESLLENLNIQGQEEESLGWLKLKLSVFEGIGILGGGLGIVYLGFNNLFTYLAGGCVVLAVLALFIPAIAPALTNPDEEEKVGDGYQFEMTPFGIILFFIAMSWGVQYSSLSLFAQDTLKLIPQDIGLYISIEYLFIGLSALIVYYLLPVRTMFFLGLVFLGLGLFGSAYTSIFQYSFMWRLLHGIGEGMIFMASVTIVSDFYDADELPSVSNTLVTLSLLGMGVGALIGAILGDMYGHSIPLMGMGLILLFISLPARKIFD